jgi:hypothetical protein
MNRGLTEPPSQNSVGVDMRSDAFQGNRAMYVLLTVQSQLNIVPRPGQPFSPSHLSDDSCIDRGTKHRSPRHSNVLCHTRETR